MHFWLASGVFVRAESRLFYAHKSVEAAGACCPLLGHIEAVRRRWISLRTGRLDPLRSIRDFYEDGEARPHSAALEGFAIIGAH